ncbi:MAG: ABC transporter ATP-binding protein [Chloroflexota bacterium]|nr:ABC transporter ATP-binding protein [Chloroflexota bacterium]
MKSPARPAVTAATSPIPAVRLRNLSKVYTEAGRAREIITNVDFDIAAGEFFVLLGKSGSGKSTLLNLISGIDTADSGTVEVNGTDITHLNEKQLTLFRRDQVGIVFQFFNLIPTLTVLENVALPLELAGKSGGGAAAARRLLESVGLHGREGAFPDKLSGGEQQRVAIARALVSEPAVVLADEPTGNLDEETGEQILTLLLELTRNQGKTLVMATHNPEIIPLADRVCRIHDGRLFITANSPELIKEQSHG